MRVAHVVRQYQPSIGGMEEVVRNLVQHQQSQTKYEPYVVTLDRVFREPDTQLAPQETLDNVPVKRLSYRGSERYPLCPQVLKSLRKADLVHVHGIDFFFDFLALTRSLHGRPLLVSTHGGFFHTSFAKRLKHFYFSSVTRASVLAYRRVIATSENDGEMFRRITGESRLRVIENGVDIKKFEGAASKTLQPTLIYFGRWSVNKGILEALDMLAALYAQQPNTPWKLIIAGREYDLSTHLILKRAAELGLGERVSVVPGPSNDDLRALISKASYFICLSHHEGFGIAPIEAMSAGLIPILSDIPPFKRLVETTGVGLILDEAGQVNRAQQIRQMHANLAAQADGGARQFEAARRAALSYSWNTVAAQYVQQYDQVLDTP
jgi:alpha-1,3-mannosyltransferase